MAGHTGINGYFAIADPAGTPVGGLKDISRWLTNVAMSSDVDALDATTFQPGVAAPAKEMLPGFRTRAITLSINWNKDAEEFFASIEGLTDLAYAYGPTGHALDMVAITGEMNVMKYEGPSTAVNGIITASAELQANTREVTTFDAAGLPVPPVVRGARGRNEPARGEELPKAA
jgi:hypothetical protein